MELKELLKNGQLPQIGFGPGSCGYTDKYKKELKGFALFEQKVKKKFFKELIRKRQEIKYVNSISDALKIGYRILDYSSAYGDGSLIGQAIQQSGISRDELFVTTRVSNKAQFTNTVREEFLNFLKCSNLNYVDLLQFHWPVTNLYLETWKEMEQLYEEGYVKHLGVANCHEHHLEEILKSCKYRPEIGQFEIHPLFTQKELIEYYKALGIIVEAYTPIARYDDRLVRLPLLKKLEVKYKKTFVQIILRWHVQNGVIPLVRSMSLDHQNSNFKIFDFTIDDKDMKLIDSININSRLRYDSDNCDFSIL